MAIFTIITGSGTVANYVIIKQDDGNSGVLQSVTPAECLTYNLYNSDTGSADTSRGFYITDTNKLNLTVPNQHQMTFCVLE